ncbi:MAG: hypothetical protein ABJA80_09895 [bacterium]
MATPDSSPLQQYARRATSADDAARREARHARRLSWARLATALIVALAIVESTRSVPVRVAWMIGSLAAAAFVVLIRLHKQATERVSRERETAAACRAGMARCQRAWAAMPPQRLVRTPDGRESVARDLDVFGDISLFRLIDVTAPALGGDRVAHWLLADPDDVTTIAQRQESVAALRDRFDFLLESARIGRHGQYALRSVSSEALGRFVSWCAAGTDTPVASRTPRIAAMACSAMLVAAIVLQPPFATPLIGTVLVVQLALASAARRRLTAALSGLGALLPQLRGLDSSLRSIAGESDVPGLFGTAQGQLRRDGAPAALGRLDDILRWNDVRLTPLAHWPLNAVAGLDVHLVAGLERWRAWHGPAMAAWVDHASSAQALIALATLAFENPAWCMPTVVDDDTSPGMDAEDAAHPLLAPDVAVPNPVHLGGRAALLVLTGSNMAGKTTYLRAVGLGALLAQAGGPVCASRMTLRRARVRTSVRIEDDLGSGVSLFLAEVTRLRDVVRDSEQPGSAPVLFLFDEILHGTNAADRRHASQVVLRRLLHGRSWGIVTTHDADLADGLLDATDGDVAARVQQGHFRESVERRDGEVRMSFDYQLRPGPTTSANARVILELTGLA